MLPISALSNTIHISTYTPLLPSSLHVVCAHTSVSGSPHQTFHLFTTLDRCFPQHTHFHWHSTSTPDSLSPCPFSFFLLLSATQHYPLYDTTIPEHDHGSHATVYLTFGTCFRSPPRLHLLAALPCNLFAKPYIFFRLSPATICDCMLTAFTIQPHRYMLPWACRRHIAVGVTSECREHAGAYGGG